MFAARDQENMVANHQAMAVSKPLNQTQNRLAPKTPGNRFPKTPIRMPLNDENGATGLGKGKSILQTKGKGNENMATGKKMMDKNAFVTPMGPQHRAPLGQKTTNVKARAFATPAPEPTQLKQTSLRPQRHKIKSTNKLEIHGDSPLLRTEDDVPEPEYCPPRVPEEPYVNDDIDVSDLDYTIVHRQARTREFYFAYYGKNIEDEKRRMEEQKLAHWKKVDEQIEAMVEMDGHITFSDDSDVERQKRREMADEPVAKPGHSRTTSSVRPGVQRAHTTTGPGTFNARRAASALAINPRTFTSTVPSRMATHTRSASSGGPLKKSIPFGLRKATSPAPRTFTAPTNNSIRAAAAAAASRSTIGYTKGRSTARSVMTGVFEPPATTKSAPSGTHSRAASVASTTSSFGRPASRTAIAATSSASNASAAVKSRIGLQRASSAISASTTRSHTSHIRHTSTASTTSDSSQYSTVTPAKFARKMNGLTLETIQDPFIESDSTEMNTFSQSPTTMVVRPAMGERRISLQDAFNAGSDTEDDESKDSFGGMIPLGKMSMAEMMKCDSDQEDFQLTPIL